MYTISLSIPESKILKDVPTEKKKFMLEKIDNKNFTTETEYYKQYQESLFALSDGWDNIKHYEIMANGCIPYFPNIDNCPNSKFPKDLIKEGNILCEKFKKNQNITIENMEEYNVLSKKILDNTRYYFSCQETARSIYNHKPLEPTPSLENIFDSLKDTPPYILFLSQTVEPSLLRDLTLIGLKQIFGKICHDYCRIHHIYNDFNISNILKDGGFTYSKILDISTRDDTLDYTIIEDIKNRKYDTIVYGNIDKGLPLYDLICKTYKPSEILMICGEKEHSCDYQKYIDKGHILFSNEF
jgi:hypothetical protein